MSSKPCDVKKPIIIRKMPMFLKKEQIILQSKPMARSLVKIQQPLFKEDIIYESRNGDFLKDVSKIILLNRLNVRTNCSRTVAKCITCDGVPIEKCSENVARLIGQTNYDTVFSALCSVISQELKVRGILALLTVSKSTTEASTQTENVKIESNYITVNNSCQTEDSSLNIFFKSKQRKRVKRPSLLPYVVQDKEKKIKKVVVNPGDFKRFDENIVNLRDFKPIDGNNLVDCNNENPESASECSEIKIEAGEKQWTDFALSSHNGLSRLEHFEDNTMDSIGNYSNLSVSTNDSVFNNLLFENVDKVTKNDRETYNQTECAETVRVDDPLKAYKGFKIRMLDGMEIQVPYKPEDDFHIATKENLEYVGQELGRKLLLHQKCIDWKYSLISDEDGNLPIHIAVLNNDLDLLRRQCLVLKIRNESVDIPANEDWTALKMAIFEDKVECVKLLLHFGADPLSADVNNKTPMHFAAEASSNLLRVFINYCKQNPVKILEDYEELWKPHFDDLSKPNVLANHLLSYMCTKCDSQGYTPLMLASKLGKHDNVKQLVEVAPHVINKQMPTSGNTALYLAVGAACTDANERGNRSKVSDNFRQTIETLVENGADPAIDNNSGSNVNVLLTEFNIGELSMIVANKLSSIRYYDGKKSGANIDAKNVSPFMIIKNEDGTLGKEMPPKSVKSKKIEKKKPVIVQNILVSKVAMQNTKHPASVKADKVDNNKLVGQKVIVSKGEQLKNIKLGSIRSETVTSGKRKAGIVIEPGKSKQIKLENKKT